MNPRKVWAIALKELKQAARDPLSLAMLLGVPTMMLLLYGFALNFDVKHVRMAVQDRDKSAASRELISAFVNSTYFDLVADLPAGADLERVTEKREARIILVIPEDYSRELAAGRPAPVQILLDGSDSNTATTVLGYANSVVSNRNVLLMQQSGVSVESAIDYEPRVWYNPELESTQFLVPGLIGFILMLTAVLSTALSVVREKERGTMEQLRVTSLRPGELIAGKMLPYLCISLTATAIILIVAHFLFHVEVKGPYLQLFLATLIYLTGALGFGLLISSFAETQAIAFQAGSVLSLLPALFLSGFIFPISAMPPLVQAITYIVPTRYFNVILRGVILKGAGLESYPRDLLFLAINAIVFQLIAYLRLRKREG